MTLQTKEKVRNKAIKSGDSCLLSDAEDSVVTDADTAATEPKGAPVADTQAEVDDFELDIQLNFLSEILLTLKPEYIAQFFLIYDCQPFSENIIRRSLQLLIKHSQMQGQADADLSRCFHAISFILKSLQRYDTSTLTSDQTQRGM